jgi:hypothetical protein
MRVRAILVAVTLAAQVVAPALALASTVRTCCCAADHGQKKCHCPACTEGRALEEGQHLLRSCGSGTAAIAPHGAMAVEPPPSIALVLPPAIPVAVSRTATAPPWLAFEVPTPPPLR